jgi:hypothetical protein
LLSEFVGVSHGFSPWSFAGSISLPDPSRLS